MNNRFQFGLTVTTMFLTLGVLLFGWVYLDALNNKYESILRSPSSEASKMSILEEENKALADRLTVLEQGSVSNEQMNNGANDPASAKATDGLSQSSTEPAKLTPGTEIPADQANKKDVYIEPRCVADPAKLEECDILATVKLTDTIELLVKPNGMLNADGVSPLTFQFEENGKKYATLHTTTLNLFKTSDPIASVVLTGKNDVTVQTKIGVNDILSTYTFDGQGWIDYSKFSQQ